ncbi:MAG: cupin domain-containing protein [Desulfuromonadales bacterium]|nr:cupin domain-containing protein [Desulfuromonadales bacterium]
MLTSQLLLDPKLFHPVRPDVTQGVYGYTFCSAPIRVTLTRIDTGGGFAPHGDRYGHIFIFLSGGGEVLIGTTKQRIEAGGIWTIPAGTIHAISNDQEQALLLLSCNVPITYPLDVLLNNLRAEIPADLPDEHFDPLYATDNFLLERIVSRGHATAPGSWYQQERPEWVYLLCGGARLAFDHAKPCTLAPGDQLLLPAGLRHRVDWTAPEADTIWLALHFIPE